MGKKLIGQFGWLTIRLAVFAYFSFLIARSVYGNHAMSEKIAAQGAENDRLRQEISALQNLLTYYQSPAFLELEARKQLNLQAEGEKVIVLPRHEESDRLAQAPTAVASTTKNESPNFIKWWQYFVK